MQQDELMRILARRKEATTKIGDRTFKARKMRGMAAARLRERALKVISAEAFAGVIQLLAVAGKAKGSAGISALLDKPEVLSSLLKKAVEVIAEQEGGLAEFYTEIFEAAEARCNYAFGDDGKLLSDEPDAFFPLETTWVETLDGLEAEKVIGWVVGLTFGKASPDASPTSDATPQ